MQYFSSFSSPTSQARTDLRGKSERLCFFHKILPWMTPEHELHPAAAGKLPPGTVLSSQQVNFRAESIIIGRGFSFAG
jgi:hypothetical protein